MAALQTNTMKQKEQGWDRVDAEIDTSVWVYEITFLNLQLHYFSSIKHNPIGSKRALSTFEYCNFIYLFFHTPSQTSKLVNDNIKRYI